MSLTDEVQRVESENSGFKVLYVGNKRENVPVGEYNLVTRRIFHDQKDRATGEVIRSEEPFSVELGVKGRMFEPEAYNNLAGLLLISRHPGTNLVLSRFLASYVQAHRAYDNDQSAEQPQGLELPEGVFDFRID